METVAVAVVAGAAAVIMSRVKRGTGYKIVEAWKNYKSMVLRLLRTIITLKCR
jgi:hypothetical protein